MIKQNIKFNINNKKIEIFELKSRFIFFIFSLIIFRIGSFIPIPGIDIFYLKKIFKQQKGTIIEMFNIFSGGALSRASVFALGIMPYISASIIIQLLSLIISYFSDLKKEGEYGKNKINNYIRYMTLIISIFQSIGVAISIQNINFMKKLVINTGFSFYITTVVSLVSGTIFLMWLCEKITERGIGNGISTIIFAGIAAGIPKNIFNTIKNIKNRNINIIYILILSIIIFSIIYFVVFIEYGQRRIFVSYAQNKKGHRFYSIKNTHLPFKINIAGVIPAIFSSSIILFITTIISWLKNFIFLNYLNIFLIYLQPNKILHILLYIFFIIFFSFFYTKLIFPSRETADNLKKSGAFLPGIRPGEQTAKYINLISTRLTFFGAIYITFICLIPELIKNIINVPFSFGGTSLLIVVVTIIDYLNQINTLLISNKYESILKKAKINFKTTN